MAFCPLCGKKLPDNGICSCGQRLDENGNIVSVVQEAAVPVQEAAVQVQETVAQAQPEPQPLQPQAQAPVQPQPRAAVQPEPQPVQPQAQVPIQPQVQPIPQGQPNPQAPVAPAAPKAPAGPNVFGEAFKMFLKVFKNPLGANQEALDGKLSLGSALILGGLYFLVVWIALMLLLLGSGGGFKFIRAFGYGVLGAVFFGGLRFGAAALISVFAKNPDAKVMKVFAATCVDTILLDCILVVMMLFQFATVYFAVFFMLIYLGIVFYQNIELLRKLSKGTGDVTAKMFWFNVILISGYAFILMIAYIIYNSAIVSSIWSWF